MTRGDGVRKRGGKWTARFGGREVTLEARTRAEAKEKRAKLVAQARDKRLGIWEGDPDATFRDIWKEVLPIEKRKGNWRTIEMYWRRHIEPAFGEQRLASVTQLDVRKWLAKKEGEGLQPQTLEHLRVRLGALFRAAKEAGVFRGENPAAAIGPVPVPEKEPRHLPFELVQDVIDAVPARWRPFFAMAVYTGLRSGELRALTRESVSPDWRHLLVSRSGTRATTKTRKVRKVLIPRAALPYLKEAMETGPGPWLFVDELGKQLKAHIRPPDILRAALEKLGRIEAWEATCDRGTGCRTRADFKQRPAIWHCPKCGKSGRVSPVSPFVFHDLRRTWEQHLVAIAEDPLSVFRMGGHSAEVALRKYLSVRHTELAADVDRLNYANPSQSAPTSTQNSTEQTLNATESSESQQKQPQGVDHDE